MQTQAGGSLSRGRKGRPRTAAPVAAEGSAAKVLRVLLAFSQEEPRHTAEGMARLTGLPLSSTYRYLALLRDTGLIEEDGRGEFMLTPRIIALARAARSGHDLAALARPHMQRLCQLTGETIILVRRAGDRGVCIERAESSSRIRLTFDVGTALPLHRGAAPKCLLAFLPSSERDAALDQVVAGDPGFAAQRRKFIRELETIRKQGWSESHAEITPHVYAAAAPVRDGGTVVAALSVVGPAFRMSSSKRGELRSVLCQAADEISAACRAMAL